MSSAPFFTLAIPTFNRAEMLRPCLESLVRQSFKDFEIIVADNASTDGTPAVVKAIADPRVKYCRHAKNIGGFLNLIFASQQGQGQVIIIHQDDDFLHHEFLQRCHDCMSRDPGISVYGTAALAGNAVTGYTSRVQPDLSGQGRTDYPLHDEPLVLDGRRMAARFLVSHFINHPAIAFRRSVLEQVGGYCADGSCFGDLVTIPKVMSAGKVGYDPRIGGVGQVHATQLSKTMTKQERAAWAGKSFRLQVEIMEKWVPGWEALLASELAALPTPDFFHMLKDTVGFDAPQSFVRILWQKCLDDYHSRLKLARKLGSRIGIKNTARLLLRMAD